MKGENRWIWFLLARALIHSLLGGVVCAVVGSLVSAACGALIGCIIFPIVGPYGYADQGAFVGASLGAMGGGVLGLLVFAVLGFITPAKARLVPPFLFLIRASVGMVIAAIIALTFFFFVCYGITCLEGENFGSVCSDYVFPIALCGPAFMSLGTIGGVVYGYRTLKSRLMPPHIQPFVECVEA